MKCRITFFRKSFLGSMLPNHLIDVLLMQQTNKKKIQKTNKQTKNIYKLTSIKWVFFPLCRPFYRAFRVRTSKLPKAKCTYFLLARS